MDLDVEKLFELVTQGDLQRLKDFVQDKKREGESFLDSINSYGRTVLPVAAFRNHPSIIQWLLSSEEGGGRAAGFTKILAKDVNGQTALHVAANGRHLDCCQALVEGCKTENGERAELLNAVHNTGWTVLHIASSWYQPAIIQWLLSSEEGGGRAAGFTSVLAKDDEGQTALHVAAAGGAVDCCQALLEGCNIQNGEREALLNATSSSEMTVLHWASLGGYLSVIEWLSSAGFSDILAKDDSGRTALHAAAGAGHLEFCQALVESAKIDNGERAELLNGADNSGWTALHCALVQGRASIIQWLLSSEEGGGRAAGFTSSSITAMTDESESALQIVTHSGSVEALSALLSGCTVGERLSLFLHVDNHGWTALHHAARSCETEIIRELLLNYPETQTIVDHRDHRGMTALHRAANGGVDEESWEEWRKDLDFDNIDLAAVVAALLTFPKKVDDAKEDGDEQSEQQAAEEDEERQEDNQQQQAAMVDPNLGTKIEQNLSEN